MREQSATQGSEGLPDLYDVHIQCPQCLSEMAISSEMRGQAMECSVCGCQFEVPLDDGPNQEDVVARERLIRRWILALRTLGWLTLSAGVFLVMSLVVDCLVLWPVFLLSVVFGIVLLIFSDRIHGVLLGVSSILVFSLLVQMIPEASSLSQQAVPSGSRKSAKEVVALPVATPVAEVVLSGGKPVSSDEPDEKMPKPVVRFVKVIADYGTNEEMPKNYNSHREIQWQMNETGQFIPEMPFVLYSDYNEYMPFMPYGWVGNVQSVSQDDRWDKNPHSGATCIRIDYAESIDVVACSWHAPLNNRGQNPAKFDISNAKTLTFWARGEWGGEQVVFTVGFPVEGVKFSDSAYLSTGNVRLSPEWMRYRIDLRNADLTHIINGFGWRLSGRDRGTIFYLDDIYCEGSEVETL